MASGFSLDRIYQLSLLYDFYGELLKEKHKRMFEDYVLNNYSLGEIAEECGISRQGVRDAVQRTVLLLEGYEEKLGLLKKFRHTKEMVEQIQSIVKNAEKKMPEHLKSDMDQVLELSEVILKEM